MSVSPSQFANCAVVVIGDVMLDHFLIGATDRVSPEAPVPIVRLTREEFRLGGAANVAANIASLGGAPILCGVIGTDDAAVRFTQALQAAEISSAHLASDRSRPTTEKLRVVTDRLQQVARIDRESSAHLSGPPHHNLLSTIALCGPATAVVLSDYAKGVVTPEVVVAAGELARHTKAPFLVDPKVPHPAYYRGATVITPNHREAEIMSGRTIASASDARLAAHEIYEASGASVLITWGEHGMFVFDTSTGTTDERTIPAAAREVSDVTGAGDTVIATLALAMACGATLFEAATLANRAAGIAVSRFGTVTVSADDLSKS